MGQAGIPQIFVWKHIASYVSGCHENAYSRYTGETFFLEIFYILPMSYLSTYSTYLGGTYTGQSSDNEMYSEDLGRH